jgi:hypothetical protein
MAGLASGARAAVAARLADLGSVLRGRAEALQSEAVARAGEASDDLAAARTTLHAEFEAHAGRVRRLWADFRAAAGRAKAAAADVQGRAAAEAAAGRADIAAGRADVDAILADARRKAEAAKAKWHASSQVLASLASLQQM